ncbi:MAG: putative Ig domain-containing protein [Gemmatimonadota bacterium]
MPRTSPADTDLRKAFGKVPPITWTPALADTGTFLVGARTYASTGNGRHYFPLRVRPANEPPTFTSTTPTQALEDSLLTYAIAAADPNGDAITYSVVTGPAGLTVDAGGVVRWRPAQGDVGSVTVQLAATDTKGATALQTFTLTVLNTNDPPVLQVLADTVAVEDSLFTRAVVATDVDPADSLAYALTAAPSTAAISAAGIITWTPRQAQVGANTFTVRASDRAGAAATASFKVTVSQVDDPPTITSTPAATAVEDSLYTYAVVAADEEGGRLTYALTAAPAGMAIDTLGVIRWLPAGTDAGVHPVTVTAADPAGHTATQSYSLGVVAVNDPPVVTRTPVDSFLVVTPGAAVQLSVSATDEEGDSLRYRWLVNGAAQAAVSASRSHIPSTIRIDTVLVQVSDGADTTSARWILDGRAIARVEVSADSAAFGTVALGDTGTVAVTVRSTGTTTVQISSLQVSNLQFSAVFGSSAIAAGATTQLQLAYIPTGRGPAAGSIQFATNDPDNPVVTLAVSGQGGVPTALHLDLDPAPGDQGLALRSAAAGDTLDLDVYATRSIELVGYEVVVLFDPRLARFLDFQVRGPEAASLLESGGIVLPSATALADSLVRATVSSQAGAAGVSGDGILGRFRFAVDSTLTGQRELALSIRRGLFTSAGRTVPDTVGTGLTASVTVSARLPGDGNGDGVVNFDDFFLFADAFGTADPLFDFDGSGLVDFDDFFVFADNFGRALARAPAGLADPQPGLRWRGEPEEAGGRLVLGLDWAGAAPLRGLVLAAEYDPGQLRFAGYRAGAPVAPLQWVVDDQPGRVLLAAALTGGQPDFGRDLGTLTFDRLADARTEVRLAMALGRGSPATGLGARPLAPPPPLAVAALPATNALEPAYPNPFNPETVLSFTLGAEAAVSLRVYDLLGREVATLLSEPRSRGRHAVVWNARDDAGRSLAAGIYLAELRVGAFRQVRKLLLLK